MIITVVNTKCIFQIVMKDGKYFRGKYILFLSCGGKFLNGGEDEMWYVGGLVRTRCIKEVVIVRVGVVKHVILVSHKKKVVKITHEIVQTRKPSC